MIVVKKQPYQMKNTAVCIGKFDGLHMGHQSLIAEISKWVVRISVVVIAFGGVKAGLGVANQSDNERNTGFMTIAGGAIMAAVAKIVEGMNV